VFWNYLVVALRNIARHMLYSVINIGGLAVGLACVIFVLLFIRDELSYDKWIPGTENLYRVEKTVHVPGREPLEIVAGPFAMPATMQDKIPEVVATTRMYYTYMTLFAGGRQFRQHIASVDPNFFTIIKFPLVSGDPANVFRDPQSLVLSESAARKYFGTANAIGKFIRTTANCELDEHLTECRGKLIPLKVTGIMRDIPSNSHLDGDMFMPNTSIADRMAQAVRQSWFSNSNNSYVVLAPGAKPETVVAKMAPLFDRAIPLEPNDHRRGSQRYTIHLTPFTDVHLTGGRWRGNEKPSGSWSTLYGVGIVGLLTLFLACFNFMNLATALASLRAQEIGLRKTFGAARIQLVTQFLGEAVLMALLSLVLALALVEILQPTFGRLLQHPVTLHYAGDWFLPLAIVGIAITAGLISGIYPALVLSGFRPVITLRAGNAAHAGSGRLRTTLVVVQFAVSIGLGIAVLVVFSQVNFARNMDLGFRKDNLLVIGGNGLLTLGGSESFVQRLRSNPGILDLALTDAIPFDPSLTLVTVQLLGHSEAVSLNRRVIGPNTVQILGMRLKAGRLLSDKRAQDQIDLKNFGDGTAANEDQNILIDEAAAASLGFTSQKAVGQTVIWGKGHAHIVGVLADVKFDGPREPTKAAVYVYDPKFQASVIVRVRPDAIPQTISFIDRAWRDFAPTKSSTRSFLDDDFGKLYQAYERQGEMFGAFVAVAIFISCLGLFGLAALTASRRTKEIGIRKVFGARTRDLVFLLLWQFSIPVLIANAIAWPIAWYWLHDWLQGFAYRITLSPLYFVAAGLAALVIAWVTIFAHALRVARANPIHALRYE
jgi:putative ABC transport system permease protein